MTASGGTAAALSSLLRPAMGAKYAAPLPIFAASAGGLAPHSFSALIPGALPEPVEVVTLQALPDEADSRAETDSDFWRRLVGGLPLSARAHSTAPLSRVLVRLGHSLAVGEGTGAVPATVADVRAVFSAFTPYRVDRFIARCARCLWRHRTDVLQVVPHYKRPDRRGCACIDAATNGNCDLAVLHQ